jgi:peptidoglycan/xylan/chitin deacetylase (PgdA/CDA1 family)
MIVEYGLVPVLMYHRVSATGASNTARYRVTPEALAEQLAYLRDAGYRSLHLDELEQLIESRCPPPDRRVMLTFDDAYVDFAETAWPIVLRYGFDATLFVVSGCTGRTNEWDRKLGEDVRLLGWDALRNLHAAGVTIGAHTDTHPHLTRLSSVEIVDEVARSRNVIEQEIGTAVRAFAYPYGDQDERVEQVVGDCGFRLAFTCRTDRLQVTDPPLSLPRIEIEGGDDLAIFTKKLTV